MLWAELARRMGRHIANRGFLGQHAIFLATKWGLSRTLVQLVLKVGVGRAAVGTATAGVASITVKRELEEARRKNLDAQVLSAGEEVAWLNAAVRPFWLHLDAGLQRFIAAEIEPALQRQVPVVGKFLRFTKLTLGEVAPQLGPVTVTHSQNGVELNVEFRHNANAVVEFTAGLASIEVMDFRISGTVQVAFGPLVNSLNPCGGVTVSCLDRPRIDLQIRSGGLEQLPNLYDFVRRAVDDAVADAIVVPNGVAVPIATYGTETDGPALRHPVPKGFLQLGVLEASGTAPLHAPYVRVQVGKERWDSPKAGVRDGRACWPEGAAREFVVFSESQSVDLQVFEKDTLSLDRLAGQARVPVRAIAEAQQVEVLLTRADGESAGQTLCLEGKWLAVSDAPPPPPPAPPPPADSNEAQPEVHPAGVGCPPDHLEMLASLRVERVSGLPPDADLRYSVRARLGGPAQESRMGDAPPLPEDTIDNETFVMLAHKLAPRLALSDFADSLGMPLDHAREFADRHAAPQEFAPSEAAAAAAWDLAWCQRTRARARSAAASSDPHMGQIMHLPGSQQGRLEVELVRWGGRGAGRGGKPVASCSWELASVVAAGGQCEGPFPLALAAGGECQLHGSIRLRSLEPSPGPVAAEAPAAVNQLGGTM